MAARVKRYTRRVRTTQERRESLSFKNTNMVRPARNFRNLPNSWDTAWIREEKSWKEKKNKKQWNVVKNEKHSLVLNLKDDLTNENSIALYNILSKIEKSSERFCVRILPSGKYKYYLFFMKHGQLPRHIEIKWVGKSFKDATNRFTDVLVQFVKKFRYE